MNPDLKKTVTVNRGRFILGVFLSIAAFVVSFTVYNNLKAGLFFAFLFFLTGAVKISGTAIPHRVLYVLYILWTVATAFVTLFLSQFCLNEWMPEKGLLLIILGMLLIIALFSIPALFTLRIRITSIVVSAVLILFTCVNYFVFAFRGSEIAPADLLSIGTAGNVAAEYAVFIPATMFYALVLAVVYYFASYALPSYKSNHKIKARIQYGIAACLCIAAVWIGGLNIKPLHWMQTGSVINGYLFNFTILLKESFPRKPDNYRSADIDQIPTAFMNSETQDEKTPDIIVVMDESYADLSKLGEKVNTDIEVTPYIDHLTENTLHGYTLSSVFGGGTPNSEYEFLSGNSFLFLPTGAIAYQQYIKEPSYSVATELKNRGYMTFAMHQYNPNSWMREGIWPLLGFDECMFIEDFPNEDILRNWGTDQELFETMTTVYEEHRETSDSPVFMFAVTIQNHGGYDYSESDFNPTVHLQGYSQKYSDVEQYLTCIHETDKAVEWLIKYFEQVDRDVVVLFYGDHYPRLNDSFFEEVHGGAFTSFDEQMLQYEVPFFIWTNYPSESEEMELTSMNYLAGLLYQRADMQLPPYQQYLEQIRRVIPACNSLGYYSNDQQGFLTMDEAQGNEKETLLEYNKVEWNCLFDSDNKNAVLFPSY